MSAPTGLGINFSQDGTDLAEHSIQADHLIGKGITKFRVNIPTYLTENENPSFRNDLTAIATMLKSKGAYVIMGYNAFPLNDSNFAAFKSVLRASAIRWAGLGVDEICVGNEEDLNLGFGSQTILRDKLKEVCEAIAVTDATDIVVSTAITTNVYSIWQSDKANWKDYMTLDLHIYGGIAASHFNNYANNTPGELSGANYYCGEFGVDGAEGSGREAFSNDEDWIKEVKRRALLLESNGWPSFYYFAYKLGASDGNNTKWSANRSGTTGETPLIDALTNKRPTRASLSAGMKDVEITRPLMPESGVGLDFQGSTGVVSLGTSNPFTGSFYFSALINWTGTNGNFQTIFAKRDSYAADGLMFSMALNNTTGSLAVDTVTSFVPFSYVFTPGKPTHMVWVHDTDTSTDKLYINGELYTSQGIGTLGTKTDALVTIGACQSPATDIFNGKIKSVVIGTGAPTADEIYKLYKKQIKPGTVWRDLKLNEGSGTTAVDSSANGVNGTISGVSYSSSAFPDKRSTVSGRSIVSRTLY